MANRRMFSKEVVRTDEFLDMPVSARELYFQLNMDADDDGFVTGAKSIIRLVGASLDDMKILIAKGFVIAFKQSNVFAIKHWNINNRIRKDRHKATVCIKEKEHLEKDESGIYYYLPQIKQGPFDVG